MLFFYLIFLLLILLPDCCIWNWFVRGAVPLGWSAGYWIFTAAAFVALVAWNLGCYQSWVIRTLFFVMVCVAVPKLLFLCLALAGRAAGLVWPQAQPAGVVAGAVAAGAVALAGCYGFLFGWKRLEVRTTELRFADLPAAFDGYRIVHLSDLHVGTNGADTRFLQRLTERVEGLQPDAILFTGDLVNSAADELEPHAATLARLAAPDGVWSVLGNHDYCLYNRYDMPDGAARNLEALKRREAGMGWRLLLNEAQWIRRGGDSLLLVGVENDGRPPFPSRGDLQGALAGAPEGTFAILLSHDPSHWRREVLPCTPVQLTLSGHTHAMQFRVGGFSPSKWGYPEWGGLYEEQGRKLHVSIGAGGTVPFRFGAWPTVDLLILRRGE